MQKNRKMKKGNVVSEKNVKQCKTCKMPQMVVFQFFCTFSKMQISYFSNIFK